jgi:hypothetical protein
MEMSEETGLKFVLPTLQGNFNLCISECLNRANQGLIYETWISLKTLHSILPPNIYDNADVEKQYVEIEKFLNRNNGAGRTNFIDQRQDVKQSLSFLAAHIQPFFRLMYRLLYEGGYLQKEMSIRKHETGVHKIGEKLNPQ